MISSDESTQTTVMVPAEVPPGTSVRMPKTVWQKLRDLHRMSWICLFLACLGASWFSYQYFLVPQPKSFAPNWEGAQWVQAADGNAPVAYFRYTTSLSLLPDSAFMTVAGSQVFRLYANGTFIGSNATDFVQGNFPRAYMYDVTSSLRAGANVIALRVANVDGHTPSVRASLGIVWGKSIYYYGTGHGWQATAQSSTVYPRYATSLNLWAMNDFDTSSWLPVQKAVSPSISPMLTANPLLYEQPIPRYWMSAGVGHDAYFVRQVSLPFGISGAWLRLAATGSATVFINGHLFIIWNSQAAVTQQGSANYLSNNQSVVQYRAGFALGVYDISPYLHSGENTIAVHVSAPGMRMPITESDTLSAAMSMDMLINDFQGHTTWFTSDNDWHASNQSVNGWAQGSDAALQWPLPIRIGLPGAGHLFYLPDSNTPQNIQLLPLSLVCEVILLSTAGVLGLWLLMSLSIMRRYHRSRGKALEAMSLAYLPAVAFEALLIVLSREPQMPRPFPYTKFWALVLILLIGISYLLLWLNARGAAGATTRVAPTIHDERFIRVMVGATPCGRPGFAGAVVRWLRLHWALIPIVLVAIPLICYNLPYEPYWQDELASYLAAKGILAHGIPLMPSGFLYPKGELYSYVLALSMLLFGDQGGAPRIVSVVEYLVSLPLLYSIGCYFFDRRVALLTTMMLAFSPITLLWGREMRMYEQAQLMTLLVVYIFYKALQEPQRIWLVYLAVACLIADYLSHEETFIILPALVLCVLLFSRDSKHHIPTVLRQKHWWYAAGIGASIIALQLLIVYVTHPPILGTDQSERPLIQLTADNIPFYINLLFFPTVLQHTTLPWIAIKPWITLNSLFAAVGCIWAMRRTDRRAKYCALFLLISFLSLVLLFTMEADRYIYPILPIYYLMGAYAILLGLRAIWTFACSHIPLPQPGRTKQEGRFIRGMVGAPLTAALACLICACVLILPVLPISGYNLFISRLAGFSYHRHFPDYDAVGQYMQEHWRKDDIVITVSPAITILYYVGHVDYFFSIDRALFIFEQNGRVIETASGAQALFNQQDFQAVLATHKRIWIISDNGLYQLGAAKRFVYPPDFHIVYEGYGSAIYFRGS